LGLPSGGADASMMGASMSDHFFNRGFRGRRPELGTSQRVPPGQYVVRDWPVLSAGPTPHTPLDQWTFTIEGLVQAPLSWTWEQFLGLPMQDFTTDIHCVTKWTKLDTRWTGVSLDTLLGSVQLDPRAAYVVAFSDGGYTTNLPLADVRGGRAWIAYRYAGAPLPSEHGGPARLLVPHLYLWKSAKWVRGLRLTQRDQPGFWESLGYNNHGDPWKEERYAGD
jgi:DMSO/TMAO reductase YedYZ molybdopterin-dependent catalytic subunit